MDKIAWAAGFIDGEGNIYINRQFLKTGRISHILRIRVGNTNFDALEELKSLFGGTIHKKHPPNYRVLGVWQCVSDAAEKVLRLIEPYLIVKRQEAMAALEFQRLKRVTNGNKIGSNPLDFDVVAQRDAYYWKLRELKDKIPPESEARSTVKALNRL